MSKVVGDQVYREVRLSFMKSKRRDGIRGDFILFFYDFLRYVDPDWPVH